MADVLTQGLICVCVGGGGWGGGSGVNSCRIWSCQQMRDAHTTTPHYQRKPLIYKNRSNISEWLGQPTLTTAHTSRPSIQALCCSERRELLRLQPKETLMNKNSCSRRAQVFVRIETSLVLKMIIKIKINFFPHKIIMFCKSGVHIEHWLHQRSG